MMTSRTTKQVVIAVIFFLIVGGLGFLIYRRANPPPPLATPNPTINLVPIQIVLTKWFNTQNNDYDFLAKVYNANTDYGSPDVEYQLSFIDSAGNVVSTKTGSFYILPGQTKYIADLPLTFTQPISNAMLKITSVDWQKLNPLAAAGVPLVVTNSQYSQVSRPVTFAKAGANVFNNSDFDLNNIDVVVVLLDQSGVPIAVGKTNFTSFLSRTTREIGVFWPTPFVGQVGPVPVVEANTNVFENSNFLRKYGGQEEFQQYY